jgi:hypothetical protein
MYISSKPRVAGGLEDLGDGGRLQAHPLAFVDGVRDARLHLVPPGHDRAPRGRARGADVEILEPDTLIVHAVHVGRLDLGVAVGGDVAVALVVGQDEDDVGPLAGEARFGRAKPPRHGERRSTRPGVLQKVPSRVSVHFFSPG